MTDKEACIAYLEACELHYEDLGNWVRIPTLGLEYRFLEGTLVTTCVAPRPWRMYPPRKACVETKRSGGGFEFL